MGDQEGTYLTEQRELLKHDRFIRPRRHLGHETKLRLSRTVQRIPVALIALSDHGVEDRRVRRRHTRQIEIQAVHDIPGLCRQRTRFIGHVGGRGVELGT